MRQRSAMLFAAVSVALALPGAVMAQQAAPLIIRSVTVDPGGQRLLVSGSGFGLSPVVTVDGAEVPVLPGGSDEFFAVDVPASLATPGTYRLTVVDPERKVGDVFVIASGASGLAAVNVGGTGTPAAPTDKVFRSFRQAAGKMTAAETQTLATQAAASGATLEASGGVTTLAVEDSLFPHRTALGYQTLINNTTGDNNTALGFQAMQYNTTGGFNTAVGAQALFLNTSGIYNTACGLEALATNTIGSDNTAVGEWALYWNTSGMGNTATGLDALVSNTTGSFNAGFGRQAIQTNTTGEYNTGIGTQVLYNNTTGSYNSASGAGAMYYNISGSFNTADGQKALFSNTEGWYNDASGYQALFSNTTGSSNTAVGYATLISATTGSSNTAVGQRAGLFATTGSYNLFLGADVFGTASDTNTIRIGSAYSGTSGQNRTFVAGIWGTPVTGSAVLIDANGQLGTPGPGGTMNLMDPTNSHGTQLRVGQLAGVADYAIGRNPADGFLDFFGTQTTYSGFRFGTANASAALTLANNGVVSILDSSNTLPYQLRLGNRSGAADYAIGRNPADGFLNFTATQSTYSGFRFNTPNAGAAVTIANGGQVGIGRSAPTQPLEMASGAYVSTGGVWTNASSRALKDQIAPLSAESARLAVDGLRPVTFVYRADASEAHVGFIAEDVPALVATRDRRSLAAMDIVGVVTRVVQEQQRQLAEQAKQLAELQARLAQLEAQLAAAAGRQKQ
jgi:trimeric autotransporter adhesin